MFARAFGKPHSPDNRQIAELHIFPEFMQRAGSLYHLDQASRNGVATGSVEQMTAAADGLTLTIKDKQGEKELLISDSTAIIVFVPGDMSELSRAPRCPLSMPRDCRRVYCKRTLSFMVVTELRRHFSRTLATMIDVPT